MNKDQYAQILKSELGYQTPSGSGLVAKYLPVWLRSPVYYIKLLSTLTYASFLPAAVHLMTIGGPFILIKSSRSLNPSAAR